MTISMQKASRRQVGIFLNEQSGIAHFHPKKIKSLSDSQSYIKISNLVVYFKLLEKNNSMNNYK